MIHVITLWMIFVCCDFQDAAPVIASFVLKLPFGKPIPAIVSSLLNHLCELLLAPFQDTTSQALPNPPTDKQLYFFPSLPIVRAHQSRQLIRSVLAEHQTALQIAVKQEQVDSESLCSSKLTCDTGIMSVQVFHLTFAVQSWVGT